MHELSSARFQSASRVKRRDFVRTFQKATVFVLLTLTFWPRGVLADSWWNRRTYVAASTRNDIRRKVLDIMQRCDMRRIAYMHGYVFPAACTNFRPLGFSLLAGWKCVTSFERSRKRGVCFRWPWQFDHRRCFGNDCRLAKTTWSLFWPWYVPVNDHCRYRRCC